MTDNQLHSVQRQFGRYELLYRLAAGGMAQLFVGRFSGMQGFEKLLAIKRIHDHLTEDPQFVKMFFDEARLAARISHPNVVQVIELGHVADSYYIAMEYVDGESLGQLLKARQPGFQIGARIVADAAAGLHEAHELKDNSGVPLNVVHRDVTPQNILIGYNGAVKVADFGVARARDNLHITSGGTLKGKFGYMSPEQATAQPVDRRSDVFALGILLYEATTRRRLFKGDGSVETLKKVTGGRIVPPTELMSDYPPRLEQIVLTALDRDLERRYQTAQEMEHELERYIVSSGAPVLPSEISALMTDVFSHRIAEKQQALRKAQQAAAPVVITHGSESATLSLPGKSASNAAHELKQTKLRRFVGAAVLLLVLIAAGLGYLAYRPQGDAGGAASLRQIQISISAEPSSATIKVAGRAVDNPYMVRRAAGEGTLQVKIAADGHETRTLQVPLTEGGRYVISLKQQAPDAASGAVFGTPSTLPAAPPEAAKQGAKIGAKKGAKRGAKRGKPGRGDPEDEEEGLYGNPFEKR